MKSGIARSGTSDSVRQWYGPCILREKIWGGGGIGVPRGVRSVVGDFSAKCVGLCLEVVMTDVYVRIQRHMNYLLGE